MNIIVLCGGLSPERDVSISTGTKVVTALRKHNHNAILVDLFYGYTLPYNQPEDIFTSVQQSEAFVIQEDIPDLEDLKMIRKKNKGRRIGENVFEICKVADIVFLALHGDDGEDGKIQAAFDLHGIKYTGTGMLGSAVSMNKEIAKKLLSQNGIHTPEGFTIHKNDTNYKNPIFPCVVKPTNGGSSIGVSIVQDPSSFHQALEEVFFHEDSAIVEQFIKGRELSVGILAGKALPAIEICPKSGFYDYKNKYQEDLTDEYCPADLPSETTAKLQETAIQVFNTLTLLVYGRIDFILDESGKIWCLEGNTLPGLTPTSLFPQEASAAGITYEALCEMIIAESLKKYSKEMIDTPII